MAKDRYISFIEMLIDLTKKTSMHWDYLDKAPYLYEGMNWTKNSTKFGLYGQMSVGQPDFNIEDSFFSKIDSTYVVLLVRGRQPASLYVVPDTYKKVVKLTADEYGELITRLLNLVQSRFPDGENFIIELLSKNS